MNCNEKIQCVQRVIGFNFDHFFRELIDNFDLGDKEVETWYLIACLFEAAVGDAENISEEARENILSLTQEIASDIESSDFLGKVELSSLEEIIENLEVEEEYFVNLYRMLGFALNNMKGTRRVNKTLLIFAQILNARY